MTKTLFKNISFNFLTKLISYIFAFFTVIYITRTLQPEIYGRISFVESVAAFFIMFSILGMPIYAMRTCAERQNDRKELSRVFNELFSLNILFAFTGIIALFLSVFFISGLKENSTLFIIYSLGIIFQAIGCEWLFKGLEKFRFIAVTTFLIKLISFLCILLFVRAGKDMYVYAFFAVFASYGSNLIYFFNINKYIDFSFKFTIKKEHIKAIFIFFIMACAVSVYNNLDITMLGFMTNNYETGLYTLASKGKIFLAVTGGIVWTAVLPRATEMWKAGRKADFFRLADKSITRVCLIQLFIAVICFIFAKKIILIIGGNEYLGSVTSFRILLLSLVPIGFSNILGGQILIPCGEEKKLLKAEIIGAVFNFFTNLAIIPLYSGMGAAVTTVISEIIVCVVCVRSIRRELQRDFGFVFFRRMCGIVKRDITRAKLRIEEKFIKDNAKYYCPCCNTKLSKFTQINFEKSAKRFDVNRYKNIEQDVICPYCYSLPRHRILVSYLNNHIAEIKNYKILHFAQEESIRIWMNRNNIKYVSADIKNTADIKLDIENTGLESDSVDMIICNHVLEHVNDYKKALNELKRIIKPNGKIIISFPVDCNYDNVYEDNTITDRQGRVKAFGQYDHLRIFGRNSKQMLQNFGFEVIEIKGEDYDAKIKPITAPGDYDYNVLYVLKK